MLGSWFCFLVVKIKKFIGVLVLFFYSLLTEDGQVMEKFRLVPNLVWFGFFPSRNDDNCEELIVWFY